MSTTAPSFEMWATTRLSWLFQPVSDRGHEDAMVLSVYRDYGVIPKSSRTDNFNRTPENLSNYQLVRPGDLVVNRMKAWQGSLGISEHEGIVSPDYEVLRPTIPECDRRFVHNLLRSRALIDKYAIRSTGIRPSQWRLYWDEMKTIEISLPAPEQQRAVADYLDRETNGIDMLIEEQQRLIELLRERRYAVVVRAIRGGVVNARMTDSGDPLIGEVPEGWSVVPIRRVATSLDSRRIPLSSEQRAERTGPFPYYGATSIIDYVDDFIFDEPLVLVAEDGFGLLYRSKPIAIHVEGQIWVNNHAHVLRPLGVPGYLLAARIESENLVPYIAGSRQPKLTAEALMGMRISIPPEDQWSQILAVLDDEIAKIDTLIAETERSVELAKERRAALITAAVTGQIDVREKA